MHLEDSSMGKRIDLYRQSLVSAAAEASEAFGDDELERFAAANRICVKVT